MLLLVAVAIAVTYWQPDPAQPPTKNATSPSTTSGDPTTEAAATNTREAATVDPTVDPTVERGLAATSTPSSSPALGSLLVTVADPDGNRVAGVPVALHATNGTDERATRRRLATDERGELHLQGLPVGAWQLSIGYDVDAVAKVVRDHVTHIALTLPAAHSAKVRVLDESGAPIAGASVWLWLADRFFDAPRWQPGVVVGQSDGHGELLLRGISQHLGNGSWVQARVPGMGASLARMIPVVEQTESSAGAEPATLVLTVSRRQAVATVVVVDQNGKPVADADLALTAVDAPSSRMVGDTRATAYVAEHAKTDERGITRFSPLAPGRWQVLAQADGHGARVEGFQVDGELPVAVTVTLGEPAVLLGAVTDPEQLAIAGARVSLRMLGQRLRATTGSHGSFRIGALAVGPVDWSVACDGFASRSGTVHVGSLSAQGAPGAAGPTTLNVTLQPLVPLRGRLVDEAGNTLSSWLVVCNSELPGYGTDRRQQRSSEDGRFELLVRSDLTYQLQVTEPGTKQPIAPPALQSVRASDSPLEVVIGTDLRPSSFLSLRLIDATGQPALASLAYCSRQQHGAPPKLAARDDASGVLKLGPLLPGPCELQLLRNDGFQFRAPAIELLAGANQTLGDVAWPAHGTIVVEIDRLPGIPDGDVLAEFSGPFGTTHMALDQQTLRGSVPVLPGHWSVTVFGDGFRSERVNYRVVAAQESQQRVVLQPAVRVPIRVIKPAGEVSLQGELLLPNGQQVFDFELEAGQPHDDWAPQLSVAEYRFVAVGASGQRYEARLPVASLAATSERREIVLALFDKR